MGHIQLGSTTPSYDLETAIDTTFPIEHIDAATIEVARKTFEGEQLQYPPQFSAIKKDGVRLYEHARKGEIVEVHPRKIHIHHFSLDSTHFPELSFRVRCSKGTYIRSLAHDLGKTLESGAHLSSLRRTKIGRYNVADAYSLDDLIKILEGPIQ